jgi:hypothetical protein
MLAFKHDIHYRQCHGRYASFPFLILMATLTTVAYIVFTDFILALIPCVHASQLHMSHPAD